MGEKKNLNEYKKLKFYVWTTLQFLTVFGPYFDKNRVKCFKNMHIHIQRIEIYKMTYNLTIFINSNVKFLAA